MNDAVDMFAKKQANMALLSVNYPHPKIEMIPSLFQQSFKVDCILFAEDTDRKSTQKLSNMKARHVLFGPVSGPVVLMRLRQIEKENHQDESAPAAGSSVESEKAEEGSDAIKVGGTKADYDDRVQVKSKRRSDAEAAASALKEIGEETPRARENSEPSESLERSGSMIIQKGQRSTMKSAVQSGPMDKLRRAEFAGRAFGRAIDQGLREAPSGAKAKLFIPPPPWTRPEQEAEREEREEAELLAEVEAAEVEAEAELAKRDAIALEKAKQALIDTEVTEAAESEKNASEKANAKKMSAVQKGAEPSSSSSRREAVKLREPSSKEEELFLRCLKEALNTVCGEPIGVRSGVGKVRAAGLVSVRSPKCQGAFVIEVGRSRLNPQDYLQRIEVAFFSILRRTGIELQQGEQFAIELEDYEIVEKAVEASDYKLISVTPDHEVAAAVVPLSRPFPTIETHSENMLKVELGDLPVEVPVTFDVFLHLPSNKKYLRYLKVGSKMSGKQSDRLGKKYRISHMYLNRGDRDAYRRHYAAQSIDPSKKEDKSA